MNFLNGAAGVVAGTLLFAVASIFYAGTQYLYPTQAAFWLWVVMLSIVVIILSPIYFWIIRPVWARLAARKQA